MKYKFWDKEVDVYTPSGDVFSASAWSDMYKWTKKPEVKVVMSDGLINGSFIGEFESMKEMYKRYGAAITDDMTDEQVLEEFYNWDNRVVERDATAEERIAAALEFQNLNSLED